MCARMCVCVHVQNVCMCGVRAECVCVCVRHACVCNCMQNVCIMCGVCVCMCRMYVCGMRAECVCVHAACMCVCGMYVYIMCVVCVRAACMCVCACGMYVYYYVWCVYVCATLRHGVPETSTATGCVCMWSGTGPGRIASARTGSWRCTGTHTGELILN